MKFRLISIISMSLLAMSLVAQNPVDRLTNEFAGNTPSRGNAGGCVLTNMEGNIARGFTGTAAGTIFAVYFDPSTECAIPNGFNYVIDTFSMSFADEFAFSTGTGVGSAQIEVTIHEVVTENGGCNTFPGTAIASSGIQTVNYNAAGLYDVSLTNFNVSVNEPVFVAWRLVSLSNAAETITPLWDVTPNTACQQFISTDNGAVFTDFQTFFNNGTTGLIDFEISGAVVQPIPTLGEWGLIAFITLMAGAALVMSRKRRLA